MACLAAMAGLLHVVTTGHAARAAYHGRPVRAVPDLSPVLLLAAGRPVGHHGEVEVGQPRVASPVVEGPAAVRKTLAVPRTAAPSAGKGPLLEAVADLMAADAATAAWCLGEAVRAAQVVGSAKLVVAAATPAVPSPKARTQLVAARLGKPVPQGAAPGLVPGPDVGCLWAGAVSVTREEPRRRAEGVLAVASWEVGVPEVAVAAVPSPVALAVQGPLLGRSEVAEGGWLAELAVAGVEPVVGLAAGRVLLAVHVGCPSPYERAECPA